jgi:hypothetical protein
MSNVRVFPNPSTGKTIVEFYNPQHKNYQLSVINIYGTTVLEMKDVSEGKIEIDNVNLTPGVYLVRVDGDEVFIGKMIVE